MQRYFSLAFESTFFKSSPSRTAVVKPELSGDLGEDETCKMPNTISLHLILKQLLMFQKPWLIHTEKCISNNSDWNLKLQTNLTKGKKNVKINSWLNMRINMVRGKIWDSSFCVSAILCNSWLCCNYVILFFQFNSEKHTGYNSEQPSRI